MSTAVDNAAPPKGKGGMLILVLVALAAMGAGFLVPRLLFPVNSASHPTPSHKDKEKGAKKPALVSFGDVVVSLGEERLTRYLRTKIILVVVGSEEKTVTEHLNKNKPYLKSWLIGYLSDMTLQEVSRGTGVNRLRREIRDQFNALLWPDGQELILEVLFDEFVVQ